MILRVWHYNYFNRRHLRPAGRGVTIAADLFRDKLGVEAAEAGPVAAEDALLLVTSVSNPANEAIPNLLPPWLTAKDSQ